MNTNKNMKKEKINKLGQNQISIKNQNLMTVFIKILKKFKNHNIKIFKNLKMTNGQISRILPTLMLKISIISKHYRTNQI